MKYIKLFEELMALKEAAAESKNQVKVYMPDNPHKMSRVQLSYPGVHEWLNWFSDPNNERYVSNCIAFITDIDYDKRTADPKFRSEALGTWEDETLPLFSETNPSYKEVEFDYVEVPTDQEKLGKIPGEELKKKGNGTYENPWIKIVDKKGVEFLIKPYEIIDIQLGCSVVDNIFPGFSYLIDGERGTITNYEKHTVRKGAEHGEVEVTLSPRKGTPKLASKKYPELVIRTEYPGASEDVTRKLTDKILHKFESECVKRNSPTFKSEFADFGSSIEKLHPTSHKGVSVIEIEFKSGRNAIDVEKAKDLTEKFLSDIMEDKTMPEGIKQPTVSYETVKVGKVIRFTLEEWNKKKFDQIS